MPDKQQVRKTLQEISGVSISRAKLQADGFRSVAKSSALFHVGYSVSEWFHPRTGEMVYEYNARLSNRPRLTAKCWEEQVAIHQALGLAIVTPGQPWIQSNQRGLFDDNPELLRPKG